MLFVMTCDTRMPASDAHLTVHKIHIKVTMKPCQVPNLSTKTQSVQSQKWLAAVPLSHLNVSSKAFSDVQDMGVGSGPVGTGGHKVARALSKRPTVHGINNMVSITQSQITMWEVLTRG